MNFDDVVKRIALGPPSPEEEQQRIDEALANRPADPMGELYQTLDLQSRPVENNTEAAVKLLVERGTINSDGNRNYRNSDFNVQNQGYTVAVDRAGTLSESRRLFVGNGETGELHSCHASLADCGKLQNLANGEALATLYPHDNDAQPRTMAAQKTLEQADQILTVSKGPGNQSLSGGDYAIQRSGSTLTVSDSHNGSLYLQGDTSTHAVQRSYLGSGDAHAIHNEYERVTDFDLAEHVGYEIAVYVIDDNVKEQDGFVEPVLLSQRDLDHSWDLPRGGAVDGPLDAATTHAFNDSAALLKLGSDERLEADFCQAHQLERLPNRDDPVSPEMAYAVIQYADSHDVPLQEGIKVGEEQLRVSAAQEQSFFDRDIFNAPWSTELDSEEEPEL